VISAISFTNTITSSYNISVASVKLRILQNPNIANVFLPGNIGFTSPPAAILVAMIFEPASPNPNANNPPIFIIVLSNIDVS